MRGITPAWAGKSHGRPRTNDGDGDHPRVGGEKDFQIEPEALVEGSPPRGRGKEGYLCLASNRAGITPAWAGKRRSDGRGVQGAQDHPRVGGEKPFRTAWHP